MLQHYFITAWRNARRDRFYAALNVLGLALGFAAVVLIGLFTRDELSYDHSLPGHESVYRVQLTRAEPGRRPQTLTSTPVEMAGQMQLDFPEIAAVTRFTGQNAGLRHGQVEATERIYPADADFFTVLGFPLIAGDPAAALRQPDSIVLTRRLAMKYFGTVSCLGQTLELNRHDALRVTGVAEDPPSETSVPFTALLSSSSSGSNLAMADKLGPAPRGSLWNQSELYLRLKPGVAPAALALRLPGFALAHYPTVDGTQPLFTMFLKPLTDLHLHPNNPDTQEIDEQADALYAVAATGLLILLLAGVNFVNLVTARATRRALEVGVRKALGGERRQLMIQFMSESVAYALVAMLLGLALAELCVPALNAFLDRQIAFDYWRHPLLALLPLGTAMLVGLTAGAYPALVLSSFAPATVLKSRAGGGAGGGRLRLALVVFQFAVTIGLLIATTVIYRQNLFATNQALHYDKNLVLTVELTGLPWHSTPADGRGAIDVDRLRSLRDRLAAIPGVEAVAPSFAVPQSSMSSSSDYERPGHAEVQRVALTDLPVDFDFFKVYGLRLVAGRGFSPERSEDTVPVDDKARLSSAILNEAALHALGFRDAEAALGQEVHTTADNDTQASFRIIGVAPDFPLDSIRKPVPPTVFYLDPTLFRVASLKLSGDRLDQTLAAIDAVWHDFVPDRPINRSFVDDRIARLYGDVTREGRLFAGFAGFAAAIGCLGLIGLSAYTAERRTKEIGIRKALGASTFEVTRLLIWQFVKPVLLANLIAWPIAWWFMRRWLDGFAYRIELDPTPFLVAGAGALVIAVVTTAFHAVQVARSRPVLALRYE